MAQRVNVKFVDDLDGSDATGTVSFAIDGRAYEIDLSEDNAARLRESLASFVAAAPQERRIPGDWSPGAEDDREIGPAAAAVGREQTAAIRAWARQGSGHQVSERGRISKTVVDAFEAAH